MLDLAIGASMFPLDAPLRLNPLYSSFVTNKDGVKDIIAKSYEAVPISSGLIQEILDLSRTENSVLKNNAIIEALVKAREKETVNSLEKHMSDYENEKLHQILQDCVTKFSELERKVDDAFDKLGGNFKSTTIDYINVILSAITNF